jgi:mitochondrial inner membrane protease subunit 2
LRSPLDPNKQVVKRIVALPGDEVTTRQPYLRQKEVVPWGYVWVEGENKDSNKTIDSNTFGPIPRALIVGRLRAVVWPWSQVCWIDAKDYAGSQRVWEYKHEARPTDIHMGNS